MCVYREWESFTQASRLKISQTLRRSSRMVGSLWHNTACSSSLWIDHLPRLHLRSCFLSVSFCFVLCHMQPGQTMLMPVPSNMLGQVPWRPISPGEFLPSKWLLSSNTFLLLFPLCELDWWSLECESWYFQVPDPSSSFPSEKTKEITFTAKRCLLSF